MSNGHRFSTDWNGEETEIKCVKQWKNMAKE